MEKVKEEKREHILNVAERAFAEFGFEGASTRFLAQEAGVNMAMINYYFGSKNGLLMEVLERRLRGTYQDLRDLVEQPLDVSEKLFRAIDIYLNKFSNKGFHQIIFREISLEQRSELGELLAEKLLLNLTNIKEIIEEGIGNGTFRPVDVETTVISIFGTIYYALTSRQVSSNLFQADFQNPEVLEREVKPRIRKFLQEYLHVFLLQHDTEKK